MFEIASKDQKSYMLKDCRRMGADDLDCKCENLAGNASEQILKIAEIVFAYMVYQEHFTSRKDTVKYA